MDSDDVVPTSDNEELEAALAETDLLESFKAASEKIKQGYLAITNEYDKYSLRTFLTDVAQWSDDAINLYDLGRNFFETKRRI